MIRVLSICLSIFASVPGCTGDGNVVAEVVEDTLTNIVPADRPVIAPEITVASTTDTLVILPDTVVAFARTLIGIPYLYASTDPRQGFDCSGFITYVFNHFNIRVPRSSVDFTDYGREIRLDSAKPGDLILFTGTDSTLRIVGHMGIVESTGGGPLRFLHSTSGKADGVVITPLGDYYMGRFVKVIRVFPESSFP